MFTRRNPLFLTSIAAIVLCAEPVRAQSDWLFSDVGRIVAVADIHGAHDAFVSVLQSTALVDEELRWSGADAHLVIVGDVLDRGPDSRRAMDLIMRLQSEAQEAGGRVHLVLGNHELMNLTGDLRYVSASEYAAFAAEESPEQRESAFQRFVERLADTAGEPADDPTDEGRARAEFDRRFPPGYFAHRAAFAVAGQYGSWLLGHPLMVLIDRTAFVHGGLSDAVIELGGEAMNTEVLQQVSDYVAAMEALTAAGALHAVDSFYDHPAVLDRFDERVASGELAWSEGLEATAARLRELNLALVFGSESPAWYRGTVGCSALIERDRLSDALEVLGVERVVVGHTPTASARVLSRMGDAVLRIDTGMLNEFYGGRAAALIIEDTELSVVYEGESAVAKPISQPRRVGARPSGLTAEQLESLLAKAQVVSHTQADERRSFITLEADDIEIEAVFVAAARASFRPDVAAYRLDRLLGLDMVPVTVARDVDGDAGSLQFSPPGILTETERRAQGVGGSAWCPLRDQYQAMYVFDSLIFNEGRSPDRIRYDADNLQLVLVGHDQVLSTKRGRPPYLEQATLDVDAAWQEALMSLTEELLTEALGDVLDRRRIRALLQRRDELLEAAAASQ